MADFSMFSGDTKVLRITVVDDNGTVVNITGNIIRWQLALTVAATPILKKQVGTGIVITNGPGGRFDVTLVPNDTLALKGPYYHEAETDNGGVISTIMTGLVTIKPALIAPGSLVVLSERRRATI